MFFKIDFLFSFAYHGSSEVGLASATYFCPGADPYISNCQGLHQHDSTVCSINSKALSIHIFIYFRGKLPYATIEPVNTQP